MYGQQLEIKLQGIDIDNVSTLNNMIMEEVRDVQENRQV